MGRSWLGCGLGFLGGLLIWSATVPVVFAQQFVERVFRDSEGEHKYQVFVPAGYSPNRPVPTILFLHGAGERGRDGVLPTQVGLGPYAKARGASFPFLTVFPQAEDMDGRLLTPWTAGQPDAERALKILSEVQQNFAVDSRRVVLVGWSMGGYGAWSLGAAHPEKWSAVVAISGGGNPSEVASLKQTPVWAFHGAQDRLVPVERSREMVAALRSAGGRVAYNEFPKTGHDIFAETFGNDGLIAWMLDPQRAPAELSKTSRPLKVEPPPFVPALDVPQSLGLRLGNDALAILSRAIPQMVPPNMLSGRLNDMYDSTQAQGRSFSVQFSGISYSGALEQVQIQASGNDRVLLFLGVRNVTLAIGGTYINGARHSAATGPIYIGIGHNQPVWLVIEVAPYVENRRLRLRHIRSRFTIPPESYYVTQPAGVSVQGLGMTRERVVSSLVSGLYGARYRVENEVTAIAPNIVRQMEEQLVFTDPSPIVAGFWPLPVYQPRVRAYPEAVSSDAHGISLVLGLTASAFVPAGQPPRQVQSTPAGVTLTKLPTGTSLDVALSPTVLSPLSDLLIDAGVARINVLDIPEPSFARLSDRAVVTEFLPDLERFSPETEVRTELVLTRPIVIEPGESSNASEVPLAFRLPGVTIAVSIREPGDQTRWQPYARFRVQLENQVSAALHKPSHERRVLALDWGSGARVTGTASFAEGVSPAKDAIDLERFLTVFRESWDRWTASGPAVSTSVPDLQFAGTPLRAQTLTGDAGVLSATFSLPTIKLTNLSDEDFVYETRGPTTAWGGPYTLRPGSSQEYSVPYPMIYRRRGDGRAEEYTLDPGTHSEFRTPLRGGPPQLFTARETAD